MATVTEADVVVEAPMIDPREDYEIVDGVIMEEPPLGVYENRMANHLARAMILFDPSEELGDVAYEQLFILRHSPSLRRKPDLAFVSRERWPADRETGEEAAWDVIPDLAVEFNSPSDLIDDLMDKIEQYFRAGVRLVWVVYPRHRKVYVYDSATSVRILGEGDDLEGGPVLPGFRMKLLDLFTLRGRGPASAA